MIPFYALINGDPLLNGLLYDSGMNRVRAWGFGEAQGLESPAMKPYVVWLDFSEVPENNLANKPCLTDSITQFDVYGRDGTIVNQINRALQSLLQPYGYITTVRPAQSEGDETKLYAAGFDFNHLQT